MQTTLPIVAIAGILCTAEVWEATLTQARITPSQTIIPEGRTVDEMAATILAAAPPRFLLAGFSLGGYVAQAILASHPERAAGILLVSTSARGDTHAQSKARLGAINIAETEGLEALAHQTAPFLLARSGRGNSAVLEAIADMARKTPIARYRAHQSAAATRPDRTSLLPSIACPAHVIVGAEDRVTPPARSEEIYALLPNARLTIVPGAGHLLLTERPKEVADALCQLAALAT